MSLVILSDVMTCFYIYQGFYLTLSEKSIEANKVKDRLFLISIKLLHRLQKQMISNVEL